MANVLFVTSGKGGVGKSTVASALGLTYAANGSRTVIIELDIGLRGLDLMLGVEDRAVYDLGNILRGECRLSDGVIPVTPDGSLSLVVAPSGISSRIDYDDVVALVKALSGYFETVIVDAPAGIGVSLLIAPQVAATVLVVATPDLISARDAGRLVSMLEQYGAAKVRLIINKVHHKKIRLNELTDLDTVIDMAGAQLIGVVPVAEELSSSAFCEAGLPAGSLAGKVFQRIVTRLAGDYVELLIQ
ncbi:MAG: hypothetical protein DBY25_06025 [Clostridiales bacterium]|nr:MAG: hypothetical protein DBY25_06025 [Clostridiales bacterium]